MPVRKLLHSLTTLLRCERRAWFGGRAIHLPHQVRRPGARRCRLRDRSPKPRRSPAKYERDLRATLNESRQECGNFDDARQRADGAAQILPNAPQLAVEPLEEGSRFRFNSRFTQTLVQHAQKDLTNLLVAELHHQGIQVRVAKLARGQLIQQALRVGAVRGRRFAGNRTGQHALRLCRRGEYKNRQNDQGKPANVFMGASTASFRASPALIAPMLVAGCGNGHAFPPAAYHDGITQSA